MPVPAPVFDPPFNVIRSSHTQLGVTDIGRARAFYEATLGLHVEDAERDALYLRGVEERQHHSLVLRKSMSAGVGCLGFKLASDEDLEKAAHFFKHKGLQHAFAERPYQGRTLKVLDPLGVPLELY